MNSVFEKVLSTHQDALPIDGEMLYLSLKMMSLRLIRLKSLSEHLHPGETALIWDCSAEAHYEVREVSPSLMICCLPAVQTAFRQEFWRTNTKHNAYSIYLGKGGVTPFQTLKTFKLSYCIDQERERRAVLNGPTFMHSLGSAISVSKESDPFSTWGLVFSKHLNHTFSNKFLSFKTLLKTAHYTNLRKPAGDSHVFYTALSNSTT